MNIEKTYEALVNTFGTLDASWDVAMTEWWGLCVRCLEFQSQGTPIGDGKRLCEQCNQHEVVALEDFLLDHGEELNAYRLQKQDS